MNSTQPFNFDGFFDPYLKKPDPASWEALMPSLISMLASEHPDERMKATRELMDMARTIDRLTALSEA